MLTDRTANAIIVLVTVVWAVNFGAQFVVHNYRPDQAVNAIFMAIVGGVFALKGRAAQSARRTGDNAPARGEDGPG